MDHSSYTHNDGPSRMLVPETAQHDDDLLNTVLDIPIDKNRIVTRAPAEPFRLTFLDATCLVINRTIGTGIFSGPQEVMKGCRSPGIAILMWCLGCAYGLVGSHVYVEYGLNVPRYVVNGVEQSVPRSGGELHYLQYVFQWPRYRKGTIMLSGVMFGICFICVGNMASNCIDCALRILQAANPEKSALDLSKGSVYGIAIAIATITCFIHAFSRRGGIVLNNVLAFVKVFLMISMIISTWVVAGGWSGIWGYRQNHMNDDLDKEVLESDSGASGYGQAFITVVFAYFGFYQPNYTQNPRRNLPRSVWWGMGIISVLYIAVNICYMIIVPASAQIHNNVAQEFFRRIFDNDRQANRTLNAFLAISSFGNIVVWTFTAARMKQEIAKQCFIPFAGFFAKNKDFSLGRFLVWLESGGRHPHGRRITFLNPQNHREKTPVGALVLHLATCIALLMATYGASVNNAYIILSKLFTYILAGWFGSFLAIGILILHFHGPPTTQPIQTPNYNQVPEQEPVQKSWSQMIKGTVNPKVGIVCAILYLIGNMFLVTMTWVPPHDRGSQRGLHGRKKFVYMTEPEFESALRSREVVELDDASRRHRGGLILCHETIYKGWQGTETKDLETPAVGDRHGSIALGRRLPSHDGGQGMSGAGLEGTDFDRS
ncbi:hypothetical protein ACCO45_000334 [Purpureocillium lilacinum]|uniref:Uncharacterized protein n=1 Tax=Purpureocillium lilacinum TaxID=33203 RepID=A0ACC4E3X2_PURLI